MTKVSTIGVLGVGIMGSAISRRLLAKGHRPAIYDTTPGKLRDLLDLGAKAANSPRALADECETVILSLPHTNAIETAVFGKGGVATVSGGKPAIIDMSSISPADTRRYAERYLVAGGKRWVDSPLSGGAPKVATGDLTVFVGGSAEDYDAVVPVLSLLASNLTLVGPTGAGQAAKLVNQLIAGCALQALAEAAVFARAAGVDVAKLPSAFVGGRADSAIVQEFLPMMASGDIVPTGTLTSMVKDFTNIQSEADEHLLSLPIFALTNQLHRLALVRGLGQEHNAAIVKLYEA